MRWMLYWRLMRFDKPIGILLLLWPTLCALCLASSGLPAMRILLVFVLGVILMRAAGCVINDIAARHIDPHVKRTTGRPLAAGELTVRSAWIVFALLMLTAFCLVLSLNKTTIFLSFVGAFLAFIYPFSKRWFVMPQFVLGLAFSWGVPMAFSALLGRVPLLGWAAYGVSALWALVYDTQYALVDIEDDIKIGVYSTARLFGQYATYWIAFFQLLMLFCFLFLGHHLQYNAVYYFFIALVAALMVYQQVSMHVGGRSACFQAFINNHWVGLCVFCGIVSQYSFFIRWF